MADSSPSALSPGNDTLRHYRDVMVHLDGGDEDENRLAHAEMIASLAGGHLTGLYTSLLPDSAFYAESAGAAAMAQIAADIHDRGTAIQAGIEARFGRLSVPNEVRRIEEVPALMPRRAAREARWADLFVASCPYGFRSLHDWDPMVEAVMFEGGHALYLVPRGVKPREAIRTAMIGWVDTRETARAVSEALPLLRLATRTELVGVEEPGKGRLGGAEAMADIATHLARHGVETTVCIVPPAENVAASLLERAHRISADLIVAGAYGHSRFREWILGGATQDLVRTTDLPLLMAH